MKRSYLGILFILIFTLTFVANAWAEPAIPSKPAGAVVDLQSAPLPAAEKDRLEKALTAYGPEKWKVLIVDTAADPGAYLDQVWAKWTPDPETILLVIFAKQNTTQLQLGASFNSWQVKFDQIYPFLKSEYNPAARDGRVVDGILALAAKVRGLMAAAGVKGTTPGAEATKPSSTGNAGSTNTPSKTGPTTGTPAPTTSGTNQETTTQAASGGDAATSLRSDVSEGVTWMVVGGVIAAGIGLVPMLIRRLRGR